MGFSGGTQHLQYVQPSVTSDGRLFLRKPESHHTDNSNPETPHYLNLDYQLHQGTKLDYLFSESSKMLEGSEIQLLENLYEQEWQTHVWLAICYPGIALCSSVPMAASLGYIIAPRCALRHM